jgi:hypothetical protein
MSIYVSKAFALIISSVDRLRTCKVPVTSKWTVLGSVMMTSLLRRRRVVQRSAPGNSNGYLIVRFEVFSAVTMKNVVFWDIETQFVPHRSHITSPLHSPAVNAI